MLNTRHVPTSCEHYVKLNRIQTRFMSIEEFATCSLATVGGLSPGPFRAHSVGGSRLPFNKK